MCCAHALESPVPVQCVWGFLVPGAAAGPQDLEYDLFCRAAASGENPAVRLPFTWDPFLPLVVAFGHSVLWTFGIVAPSRGDRHPFLDEDRSSRARRVFDRSFESFES